MKYEMRVAPIYSAELQLALADGWVPFSVAHEHGQVYLHKRIDEDEKPPGERTKTAASDRS